MNQSVRRIEINAQPVQAPPPFAPERKSKGLSLTVRGLRKSFGDNTVLRGIDLDIPAGQFVAIVGKSGCGKSTLLRLIAGLDKADAGTIGFGGEARKEDVRVMFQEPRLLPWALMLSNVEVGLGAHRGSKDATARAEQALGTVGLIDKRAQWPAGFVLRSETAGRAGAGAGQPSARAGFRRTARRARRTDAHLDAASARERLGGSNLYSHSGDA